MNGTDVIRIPAFLEGEPLPAGYNLRPNPYAEPPATKYNLRAMVHYAMAQNRSVTELTKEEADRFLTERYKEDSKPAISIQ